MNKKLIAAIRSKHWSKTFNPTDCLATPYRKKSFHDRKEKGARGKDRHLGGFYPYSICRFRVSMPSMKVGLSIRAQSAKKGTRFHAQPGNGTYS